WERVAERSKALRSGRSLETGVGSNPTALNHFNEVLKTRGSFSSDHVIRSRGSVHVVNNRALGGAKFWGKISFSFTFLGRMSNGPKMGSCRDVSNTVSQYQAGLTCCLY
ncbi:unnamed protein product, partial [Discosporangium mesarthrocarpum]